MRKIIINISFDFKMEGRSTIMRKYVILFCTVSIMIVSLLFIKFSTTKNIRYVDVYKVNTGSSNVYIQCSGKIEAASEKEVYIDKTAYINTVNVGLGQSVDIGDVLADIDYKSEAHENIDIDLENITNMEDYLNLPGLPAFDPNDISLPSGISNSSDNIKEETVTEETIISSHKGIITELNINEDTMAATSKPIFVISDLSTLYMRCDVPESQISDIKKGHKAMLKGSAFKSLRYLAIVESIAPTAKENLVNSSVQTTVEVLLKIANPDENLKPGFSADAKILIDSKDNIMRIPYETIMQDIYNNEFVYVYKSGSITKRIIKSIVEGTDTVEVEGLKNNELIVFNPDESLYSGQRVKAGLKK